MQIGLGLYRPMLTEENFRFARQCGATHIVAHWVDYFRQSETIYGSLDEEGEWGEAGDPVRLWDADELRALRERVEAAGLTLAAIENFDPAHWHDILLDGPKKREQIEDIKRMIESVGRAGIPAIGYNFSIAGVWGHVAGPWARGGAESVAFRGPDGPEERPIRRGHVWNMRYDPAAPGEPLPPVSAEDMWFRLEEFLAEVLPVAEAAGVQLALHPDDPPMPTLRGHARLVYKPELYQRVLDLAPSPSNRLEFCLGSIAEMDGEIDIYEATDRYSRAGAIAYVHFRNVRGKVPRYEEVFLDEGDIDMIRILRILKKNGYGGVLVPDHTPSMSCAAPWHAGMAWALGYLRAALSLVEQEPVEAQP